MAVQIQAALDRRPAPRRFPDLRADVPRQAARLPRLGGERAEAAAGARRDDAVLRDVVRERASRRLRARRARDGRPRRRTREGCARSSTRPPSGRSSSSATRPRRSTSSPTRGVSRTSAPATSCSSTELEHHSNFVPVAVHREPHGRRLRDHPGRPTAASSALDAARRLREREGRRRRALVSNSLGTINDVAAHRRLGARARRDPRLRRARRPRRTCGSTCRRSAPTSSRSRATRCAGRAGSASSGAARSCCWRWSRS